MVKHIQKSSGHSNILRLSVRDTKENEIYHRTCFIENSKQTIHDLEGFITF